MKEELVTCDLCNEEMYSGKDGSGHSLHIKNKITGRLIWWWIREPSRSENIDICSRCYYFIRKMLGNKAHPLRIIYEMYCRMCIADQDEFQKKLFKLAKKIDRYYKNHPID